MLNGVGNVNGTNEQTNKQTTRLARVAHFFVHFFAVVLAAQNFLVTPFMEKMSYVITKNFTACVFSAAHFHLAGRLHFSFSHR